jgi:hypothetical protein
VELARSKFCTGSPLMHCAIRVRQLVSCGLTLELFSIHLRSAIEVLCKLPVQTFPQIGRVFSGFIRSYQICPTRCAVAGVFPVHEEFMKMSTPLRSGRIICQ